jgi:hypothetical protein
MTSNYSDNNHYITAEIYFLFQSAFNNGYKVFFFNCGVNHNLIFTPEDCKLLQSSFESVNKKLDTVDFQSTFSKNIFNIKDHQSHDFFKIYDLAINSSDVGAFFTLPKLENGGYCYDFFLIVKSKFNLNEFFNINFNIITIKSVIEYKKDTLTFHIISKLYALEKSTIFRDYIIPCEENNLTTPYNLTELPE